MNSKLVSAGVIFLVVILAFAGTVELPLPEGVSKRSHIIGYIEKCNIKLPGNGKYKSKLFVGLTVQNPDLPYLRWNPEGHSVDQIRAYCEDKANVEIWYKAQRLILRPKVSYWITKINVQTNS